MNAYILAVDQSTQGTKGVLFDERGRLICRSDRPHRQIVNQLGWVEHDPMEILDSVLSVCREVILKANIPPESVAALGISNQRETSLMWDKSTGKPIYNAIVWQCVRGREICEQREIIEQEESIRQKTGLRLSPYFPAAKLCWLMENVPAARELEAKGQLASGTVDSWLIYQLTGQHKTDYSNASRTQLFDIVNLKWDEELCRMFSIPMDSLPQVCMSDALFGMTDLGGILPKPIPLCGVLGDSHGALFGQNCRTPGAAKATYGTGSSVMMHIGDAPRFSDNGLVTSLAWGIQGKVEYVLEGNLNYTGAVITWLKNEVGLIQTEAEATELAQQANPEDRTYFVPAFTGLGAPYWDAHATGMFTGITRTTGKKELVKACLECIAYQISDLTACMEKDASMGLTGLRVDGGPTASGYLMQFQSDICGLPVFVPQLQELSALGAAYVAGMSAGIYGEDVFENTHYSLYEPKMSETRRKEAMAGWKSAVARALQR